MSAKRARKPTGADVPGKRPKMPDGTTSDGFPPPPIPFSPSFAHRKPEHMAEARLPGDTPLSPISIFPLYWGDEILEK